MQLNAEQQAVVDFGDGALLVLACPGSGKTRCLTSRIITLIDKGVNPTNILAVTFTNKAANEMLDRIKSRGYGNGLLISTFHSFCAKVLRKCATFLGFKKNFSICDESGQHSLMRRLIKQAGLDIKQHDPKRYISKLEKRKNNLISAEEFYKKECDTIQAKIFAQYQDALKSGNSMDFSDLIEKVIELFDKFPAIQEAYAARFKHILVDEMQDTNTAQMELLKRLTSKYHNIVGVGDDKQGIYSWRSANVHNITQFERHFPGAQTIILGQNYRSTPEITSVADNLIKHNKTNLFVAMRPTNPSGSKVRCHEFDTIDDEAEETARYIDGYRLDGYNYENMAILCRMNSLTRAFEQSFRRNEIPYVLIGAFGFYDRKEVKTALAYMKFIVNPDDVLAFEEIAETPSRGIGPAAVAKIIKYSQENGLSFKDACIAASESKIKGLTTKVIRATGNILHSLSSWNEKKPYSTLLEIYEDSGFLGHLRSIDEEKREHREDNIMELLRGFRNYCANVFNPTLVDYLQNISLSSTDDEEKEHAVKIMTVHASKGTEHHIVFVPGMEEETFPHKRSIVEGNLEEERRVAYVAFSRAKEHLIITRSKNGHSGPVVPSRFLVEAGLINGFSSNSDIK